MKIRLKFPVADGNEEIVVRSRDSIALSLCLIWGLFQLAPEITQTGSTAILVLSASGLWLLGSGLGSGWIRVEGGVADRSMDIVGATGVKSGVGGTCGDVSVMQCWYRIT